PCTDGRRGASGSGSALRSASTSSVVETSRSPWRAVSTRSPAYVAAGTGTYPVNVPSASARTVNRTAPSTSTSTWPGSNPVRANGSQRPAATLPPSPSDTVGSPGSTVGSGGSAWAGSVSTATGPRSPRDVTSSHASSASNAAVTVAVYTPAGCSASRGASVAHVTGTERAGQASSAVSGSVSVLPEPGSPASR